ncbi:MAG: TetR/AcrR family transcriptional regulator [Solirubrobacterales bacterium]
MRAQSTRTRLEPDIRREQILEVARRLFSERTYAAVSTVDIAREAGVARGLLHHHFGTKRELYLEVVRELVQTPPPIVAVSAGRSREEVLSEGVELWLDMVESNRGTWLAAVGAEGFGRDPEIERIVEKARRASTKQVMRLSGLDREDYDDREVRAVIRAYGGLAEAATTEWIARGRLTREQVRVLLTDTLLSLLGQVLPKIRS